MVYRGYCFHLNKVSGSTIPVLLNAAAGSSSSSSSSQEQQREEFNGVLAESMITAIELWRVIAMFL